MRRLVVAYVAILVAGQAHAQDPDPADVSSVDAIMTAVYDVISGPANTPRDWDRFRSLFIPEAKLTPIGIDSTGAIRYLSWSPEEFVTNSGPFLDQNAFYEIELHRKQERYGNMVHAFSTYASYQSLEDEEPFNRGINSFQLLHKDGRWWVVSIYWQPEWPDLPIPEQYLPSE